MWKMVSWCREAMIPRGQTKRQIARDFGITIGLLAAAALVCVSFNRFERSDSSVPLVFVLAVLLTSRFTEGYFYGMFASVASVFGVNYAFTYPYFEFNFTLTGYPLTFLSMFAISMVVGMLTEQVKRQSRIELLAEKEKMKANLLRSVSHDLRTPLTSIIGSASAILENYDIFSDDVKKDLLEHVRDDAQWLVRLVENILSITRIKDGVVRIRKSPEAVEEILAEAVEKFRKNRSLPVRVRVPDDLLFVPMDATLIEQVLINLMDNVVNHAEGASEMEIGVTQEGNMARFSVVDNGKGFSQEVLPVLFEELFPHAKEQNADGRRNLGIGLSACMSVVRAHGGTMGAENLAQGGAMVYFLLPIEEDVNNGGQG